MTTQPTPAEELAERKERTRESLEDILVVDVDVHVHEIPSEMAAYCDMPWRKSLQRIGAMPDDRYLDLPGFSPGNSAFSAPYPGGHDAARVVTSPEQMRQELEEFSIDLAVLFPDHLLKLAVFPQADYAAALARAYNAWLIDRWCLRQRGLLGCLIAAPQDPEDAAREIERYAREPGIVGVYLPTAGVDPLWGHRGYNPIFQAAQDADLPVLLHSVTVILPVFPCQVHKYETPFAKHAVAHTFSMMANLVSLIETGVPERFPHLRIAFTESGLSWVPFIMNRLDKEYIEHRREMHFLRNRPSQYIRRFYFATQPLEEPENPSDMAKLIEIYGGEDTTMFASDWPHHDFDHPRLAYQLPFTAPVRRKIMGENALNFFRIDAAGQRLKLKTS